MGLRKAPGVQRPGHVERPNGRSGPARADTEGTGRSQGYSLQASPEHGLRAGTPKRLSL